MVIIKEGAKSILGKRNLLAMNADKEVENKGSEGKRGKVCKDSNTNEVAKVLQHPCQEQ